MKTRFHILIASLLVFPAAASSAADTGHGKTLVQQHCTACHKDGVYTRQNRRVTSLEGLHKQVKRCELTLELKWFDDDVNDVAGYLNESFYKF
ncbi:MAG: cytochrome c [Gammaproteobacteria bacterium]